MEILKEVIKMKKVISALFVSMLLMTPCFAEGVSLTVTDSAAVFRSYIGNADSVMLDLRPEAAYMGWKLDGAVRGGHVAGAMDFPVSWLKLADDDSFTVLERIEGGQYLSSTCAGFPAAIGWATGNLPEPPNNPQVGMMNMRGVMPALMKAQPASVGTGGIAYAKAEVPAAKRDTVVKKDMAVEEIAAELVEWIKQ